MPQDPTDDKSTLIQVMAWGRQATSQYLNQCWARYIASLGHNELTPWWSENAVVILNIFFFKLMSRMDIFSISWEIALGLLSQELTDD